MPNPFRSWLLSMIIKRKCLILFYALERSERKWFIFQGNACFSPAPKSFFSGNRLDSRRRERGEILFLWRKDQKKGETVFFFIFVKSRKTFNYRHCSQPEKHFHLWQRIARRRTRYRQMFIVETSERKCMQIRNEIFKLGEKLFFLL